MKPFDLQVNGYAGVDFNGDELTGEQLHHACACLAEDGVGGILAAIITDSIETMCARLSRLAMLRGKDKLAEEIIAGIHIEGPFISPEPGYVGAHPAGEVKRANRDDMARLLDACGGLARLVTLAPEQDAGGDVIRHLVERGVTVSAGHCNPSLDELKAALDAGLSMFTHLGNGCPMEMPRHDNIIQRVLSLSDRLRVMFIGDGVHIDLFALENYVKCAGIERSIMVTDAISAARLGPGRHTLAGWDLQIGSDLVARAPDGSHFVGSTATMLRVRENLARGLGLSDREIDLVTAINPREALGLNGIG